MNVSRRLIPQAAYVFLWTIETWVQADFHKGYFFDLVVLEKDFSFASPYTIDAATTYYAYALCAVTLAALYTRISYVGSIVEVIVFGMMQLFTVRYWFEVPFEPIFWYVAMSIWIVMATVLSTAVLAWRIREWNSLREVTGE